MGSRINRSRLLASVAVASLASLLAPVHATAQTAAAVVPSSLAEVVVTAERRSLNLQKTPLSIVALSSDQLAQRGVTDVGQLATFTPGLSIGGDTEGGAIRPLFVIRGVGQASGRASVEALGIWRVGGCGRSRFIHETSLVAQVSLRQEGHDRRARAGIG